MIYLRATSYMQPSLRISSAQIASWIDSPVEFLEQKVGIRSRAYAQASEATSDLALTAARQLLAENPQLAPDEIGLLIVVTQNPDTQLPHTAAIVQNALGLPSTTASFDLALGCSGFVYGLTVAQGFMQAQSIRNAILITADPYSKIMNRHDRSTVAVFGDAAAASWISLDGSGQGSGSFGAGSLSAGSLGLGDFGTDGDGARYLCVTDGGARHPYGGLWQPEVADGPQPPQANPPRLHMDGRAVFNFMMRRVPASIDAALARNGLTREAIDYFIFHQASRFLLTTLVKELRIDPAKVPIELEDIGNTVSSTIPITLRRLSDRTGGLAGKTVLISGFGVGLSWATNILRY